MLASCWVARKIFLSAASASSSARTLDSRPTTNGVIMKGKMTTSRMGIIGNLRDSKRSLVVWGTGLLCGFHYSGAAAAARSAELGTAVDFRKELQIYEELQTSDLRLQLKPASTGQRISHKEACAG